MANTEHLKILKSGVEDWNKWREGNENIEPDLSGVNLSGANLSEANLSKAEISGSDLYGANLSKAKINKAELIGALLAKANLSGADLSKANLSGADLSEANLSGAYLSGADFSDAYLSETNLSEADLSEANLSGANLSMANFTYSIVENTNFSNCSLYLTIFGLTDLSTCKGLENVKLHGPCVIDFTTLRASKNLSKKFQTKLGIPNLLMEYLPEFYDQALMIYPVFLSHSWADKEFVRKLYEALTKEGVTAWLDEKKMKPGDNIHDSIGDAIKYYDKLILVCSENALNSWWVEKELERIFEKERELQKKLGKKFRLVVPIRIDDNIFQFKYGIAATVKNSLIGDFTKWQDDVEFEKAVKELVDALNANRPDIKPPSFL